MAKRTRRTFTPHFKAEVVLAILSGRQTMAEICRQQSLKPDLVSLWKKPVLSKLPGILVGRLTTGSSVPGGRTRTAGGTTHEGTLRRRKSLGLLPSAYGNCGRS